MPKSIVKRVLDWTEEKYDEIDENTKHPYLKSVGIGMIEGFIDGAILAYPILMLGCIVAGKELKKLRNK